uniref:Seven TM Receptor n=1 Tax=Caenorhabditis tropicalis TaxID=1561998 RepID=A0A1I7US77_9PELO
MFSKGRSLCVCSNGPLRSYRSIGVPLTTIYCGSFGLCISLLALHFFYRYIAVCKPDKMYYFDGKRILLTFLPPSIIFITWSLTTYYPMMPDAMREEHYYDVLMENFHTNAYEASFLVMMYKSPKADQWIISQLLACGYMCSVMSSCFSVILFCGWNSLKQMKNCASHMSSRTRELNRQLFVTLGIQTLLPVITMYLPVGLIIVLPIFGIEVGVAANKTAAFLGLYPALDPLIAMLLIKDFRNVIFCKAKAVGVQSVVSNTSKNGTNQ